MLRYAVTIFLSAFLLFQVQPIIARFVLPWFGGTAAVWTTCMMFFQFFLLIGYSYAHLLRSNFSPRMTWLIHTIVMAAAACFAQIVPAETLMPTGDENLNVAVVTVLTIAIGFPFFVLSSTGPLIQAWQSISHPQRSPYRLYALSNLGSMLALLSYPFLVERFLPLAQQARIWSIGFLLFTGLCCWSGWQTVRLHSWDGDASTKKKEASPTRTGSPEKLGFVLPFVWMLLSMTASVMLLATTNLMCQEVASVPFLWILPLSLYLLSFIVCFDRPAMYRRRIFSPMLVVSTIVAILVFHLNVFAGLLLQVAALATVCFAVSMTCHGELERLKPAAKDLTRFYLLIAVGGSLGGIFTAVFAPHLFSGFYEFHIALLICLLVPAVVLIRGRRDASSTVSRLAIWSFGFAVMLAATIVGCSLLYFLDPGYHPGLVYRARNEYGLVSVVDRKDRRVFINGRIEHGGQLSDPELALQPSAYYVRGSGVSISIESFREFLRESDLERGLRVGILGLGAGGMVTWSEEGDEFVFYEINPLVEHIARNYFSYLSDGNAQTEVILGDGRIQLQRNAEKDGQRFDLIFMDAFASDSIPIHLITSEAFDVYCRNLTEDGVLVAHITNRFVDLRPVIYQAAIDRGMTPLLIDFESTEENHHTRWVLMTKNDFVLNSDLVQQHINPWPDGMPDVRWTDDYASLAALLDWSGNVDWAKLKEELRERQQ